MLNAWGVLKKATHDFIKYNNYMKYYVKTLQKSQVSDTSLGILWWFLDPLLNMGIYIILVRVVFQQRDQNFPIFFFSAMLVWRYFSTAVQQSTTSIRDHIHISRDTYIPKFIFPFAVCVAGLTPLFVSLVILTILMLIFQVPLTINLLYLPLLSFAMFLFTWTCCLIVAQINMWMNDFRNIIPHMLTLGMFATPIFYDITKIPEQYIFLIKLNPVGILTTSFRNIFLYGMAPPLLRIIYLIMITCILIYISLFVLYKYDQTYNRMQ